MPTPTPPSVTPITHRGSVSRSTRVPSPLTSNTLNRRDLTISRLPERHDRRVAGRGKLGRLIGFGHAAMAVEQYPLLQDHRRRFRALVDERRERAATGRPMPPPKRVDLPGGAVSVPS